MTPARTWARSARRVRRVCRAKDDSEEGRCALAELCGAYYEPVVAYLRGALRTDDDAARELTHGFFAGVSRRGHLDSADPGRGRFRSPARGREALPGAPSEGRLRRGGGVATLSIDEAAPDSPALQLETPPGRRPKRPTIASGP